MLALAVLIASCSPASCCDDSEPEPQGCSGYPEPGAEGAYCRSDWDCIDGVCCDGFCKPGGRCNNNGLAEGDVTVRVEGFGNVTSDPGNLDCDDECTSPLFFARETTLTATPYLG